MKKGIFIALALVFALFAYFNLNDPDPIPWVAAYAVTAVLFGAAAFGHMDRRAVGIVGLVLFVWLCSMIPGMVDWFLAGMPSIVEEMHTNEPHIEVVREFLGLFIAVSALGVLFASARPNK